MDHGEADDEAAHPQVCGDVDRSCHESLCPDHQKADSRDDEDYGKP